MLWHVLIKEGGQALPSFVSIGRQARELLSRRRVGDFDVVYADDPSIPEWLTIGSVIFFVGRYHDAATRLDDVFVTAYIVSGIIELRRCMLIQDIVFN